MGGLIASENCGLGGKDCHLTTVGGVLALAALVIGVVGYLWFEWRSRRGRRDE